MSHYAIRNVRADENMTDALHFVFLKLGRMKYTDEQRRRYEAEFFAELEKKSELKAAREDGLEQGIQQGIEKGLEQGLEQGKLQMAKELKAAKVEVEIISRASGLTVEEVEAL